MSGGPKPATRSFSSLLDAKYRSTAIRQAIAELDEEQKCALVQRIQGATFEQIGIALDASEESAHKLVRSAKARLRRSLRQIQEN